jgi:hypothetical protein
MKEIRKPKKKRRKQNKNGKGPRGSESAQYQNQPAAQEALYRNGILSLALSH